MGPATDTPVCCSTWMQPGSLGVTFRAPYPAPHHIHRARHKECATRCTGPPFPAQATGPAMPTSHQVCLCLFPGVHIMELAPASDPACHSSSLPSQGLTGRLLPRPTLPEWTLLVETGGEQDLGGGIFRRLLD